MCLRWREREQVCASECVCVKERGKECVCEEERVCVVCRCKMSLKFLSFHRQGMLQSFFWQLSFLTRRTEQQERLWL